MFTPGCTLELVDTLIGVGAKPDQADADTGADAGSDGDGGEGEGGGGDEDGGGDEGEDGATLFDVAGGSETGGMQVTSCAFTAQAPSNIGCEFYGFDVDGPGLFDHEPYGFVVINPLPDPVEVELQRHALGVWTTIDHALIAGEDEHVFLPDDNHVHGTGVHPGTSQRIRSDQPIIVIQAHPATGQAISSSATMLAPSTAWSTTTPVAGWRTHLGVGERSFLAVLSRTGGTTVVIKPSFGVADVPAQWADQWIDVDNDGALELVVPIEPGEVLRLDAIAIDAAEVDHGISGSTVQSGQEHPTSLFSGHTCASIPDYEGTCGHLQEQLCPKLIGTRFVAPRLIATHHPGDVINPDPQAPLVHERTMIQVVATAPATTVVFSTYEDGVAVELDSALIDPVDPYAVYVTDRDLAITSDKPIIAAAYMTNAGLTGFGSPSMVQLAPVDQWTGHHWVWAPAGYETHLLVSSSATASVAVEWLAGLAGDDSPQPSPEPLDLTWAADADQAWVIRRFVVGPGIHRVVSTGPASVVVTGWRGADGFAYLGGWGQSFADFRPEG